MATLKTLVNHPDIVQAFHHHQENNFSLNNQEAIYTFWANDVERDKNGKLIEHHGKKIALNYQKNHDNVYLMENFEGEDKVLSLNDYEKRQDISLPTISAVCALASASYAKSAKGIILTSVKGANINSFFRTNELPLIMNNPNITHIINVSRDDPIGTVCDKKKAYHILRDEWLDSAIQKFKEANINHRNNKVHPEIYETALNNMAAEIVLSQKAFVKKMPDLNILVEYQNYNFKDQKHELERINKSISLMKKYPELKPKVDELNKASSYAINDYILGYFNNISVNKQTKRSIINLKNLKGNNKKKEIIKTI